MIFIISRQSQQINQKKFDQCYAEENKLFFQQKLIKIISDRFMKNKTERSKIGEKIQISLF